MSDVNSILLTLFAQGTVVLVAAFIINRHLRRRSAALRHLIWLGAFGILALMPVAQRLSPKWKALPAPAHALPSTSYSVPGAVSTAGPAVDFVAATNAFSTGAVVVTGVTLVWVLGTVVMLQIAFDLPEMTPVRLVVYDVLGRLVEVLVDDTRPPGRYTVQFDASSLSSGLYLYRMETRTGSFTRTMILMK